MNNEIKEILKVLEIKSKRYNHHLKYGVSYENIDEDYQAHLLLDYITNLQEKVKLLTTGLEATDKAYKDYKSRNEKAVEYIKQAGGYIENINRFKVDVYEPLCLALLNILQGDDKE